MLARKTKVCRVTEEYLRHLLFKDKSKDVIINAVEHDRNKDLYYIFISSEEFDEVIEGGETPIYHIDRA